MTGPPGPVIPCLCPVPLPAFRRGALRRLALARWTPPPRMRNLDGARKAVNAPQRGPSGRYRPTR